MSNLLKQQNALIRALFEWPPEPAAEHLLALLEPDLPTQALRGLQAYQGNGHLLAERVLQAAYPVLQQMLGAESFSDLARALGDLFKFRDGHGPHDSGEYF